MSSLRCFAICCLQSHDDGQPVRLTESTSALKLVFSTMFREAAVAADISTESLASALKACQKYEMHEMTILVIDSVM